jgi:Putative DNA-binding domain
VNQADFARALFDPALPVPSGWGTRQGGDATARTNVYRNNVVFTLVQALRETFPVLAELVGQAQFDYWALDFVHAYPPTHPVLTFYGAAFPSALAQALDEPQAHLADLARLELARIEAFHAQDDAPMAPSVLAALLSDPERLAQVRLPLCAGVTVLSASGPIFDLWAAQQNTTDSAALAVRTEGQSVLVAREGWNVVVLRIDAASARFYAELQAGHTLAQAMDEAFNTCPEFDPSTALSLLLRQGCIRAPNDPHF